MSVEPKLGPILEKKGFQNIANAIRQSTVMAQYWKSQGDRRYNVRYGLGQELNRKANYPADFIAALSDFMHKFNAENAQVMETRQGPYRKSLVKTDIDDIVALVDEYGSVLICNLLVAYGYARLPRASDSEEPTNEDNLENDESENDGQEE